jgi:RNA polymerase sigma factor (sigma-70 family)
MSNSSIARLPDVPTPISLLEILRRGEATKEAWDRFVDRYGPVLYRWCKTWGLQPADAQDVAQNTLLAIVRQIQSFDYDQAGSFRAFLKTIAHRCYLRALQERQKLPMSNNPESLEEMDSLQARENLEKDFDHMARVELFELASSRVKLRVEPHTWEAFHQTAILGRRGDEVAKSLGINLGTVYMARNRVQSLLKEEWQKLDPNTDFNTK